MRTQIKNLKLLISKCDRQLLVVSLLFFVFGLLNIVTASSREAVVRYEVSTYYYFYKQLKTLAIGLVLSYILINLSTKSYKVLIPIAYGIVLALVLSLFVFGDEINGAVNWISLPIIGSLQPSELAKPIMIMYISILLERYARIFHTDSSSRYEKIGFVLLIGVTIPAFTFLQKDLGSALIMLGTFLVLFIFSPIKKLDRIKTVFLGLLLGIVLVALVFGVKGYILSDAQMSRFNFFNPCSRYETTGYQVCNGFIALNNGGVFGLGIGKSKQKYSYIPEPHTDSIFAIIGEEYGALKCSFIFAAYIYVLYRILKVSSTASTVRGKYICLGIATYLFLHIFINLGGLFGIIPLTGVPLPFLSYGGSFAISLMCSLAVVQRICIETKLQKIKINNH